MQSNMAEHFVIKMGGDWQSADGAVQWQYLHKVSATKPEYTPFIKNAQKFDNYNTAKDELPNLQPGFYQLEKIFEVEAVEVIATEEAEHIK